MSITLLSTCGGRKDAKPCIQLISPDLKSRMELAWRRHQFLVSITRSLCLHLTELTPDPKGKYRTLFEKCIAAAVDRTAKVSLEEDHVFYVEYTKGLFQHVHESFEWSINATDSETVVWDPLSENLSAWLSHNKKKVRIVPRKRPADTYPAYLSQEDARTIIVCRLLSTQELMALKGNIDYVIGKTDRLSRV